MPCIFVNKCLSRYLGIYRKSTVKILTSFTSQRAEDYRPPVARTIQMSLDRLPQEAQDLLRLFAHLDPTSIPHGIISKAAERRFEHVMETKKSELNTETLEHAEALRAIFFKDGEWSDFDFNELVTQCLQYSLLQIRTRGEDNFYSMHILVRSYLKASTTLIRSHRPGRLAVRLLGSFITEGDEYEFFAFNRLLLPHFRLIPLGDVIEAGDHFGFGMVLNETGAGRLALAHQELGIESWRVSLGDKHENTLKAMMAMANSYRMVGMSQEALRLQEQVLELRRDRLGIEHTDTLEAMHKLAISYDEVGRTEEAMKMKEQVLEMRKTILGPEDPSTLKTMNNLAASYATLGRDQDALKLDEQVLKLRKKVLGPEHPDTLMSMHNLAASYSTVGRETEAIKLKEQVVELRTKVLGPEHPDTLMSMFNLSVSYNELGRFQEKMKLEEEIMGLRTKVLGLEHPDTVDVMWNLVCSLKQLGLKERRLDLLRVAVPAHEKAFGVDHSKTIQARSALKTLLSELSQQDDVVPS